MREQLISEVKVNTSSDLTVLKSLTKTFRNDNCIDCCIKSQPKSQPKSQSIYYKELQIDMWRPMKKYWYFCSSDIDWSNKLYLWGKNDAETHKDELSKFFNN